MQVTNLMPHLKIVELDCRLTSRTIANRDVGQHSAVLLRKMKAGEVEISTAGLGRIQGFPSELPNSGPQV